MGVFTGKDFIGEAKKLQKRIKEQKKKKLPYEKEYPTRAVKNIILRKVQSE